MNELNKNIIFKEIAITKSIENDNGTFLISDFNELESFMNSLDLNEEIKFCFDYKNDIRNLSWKYNKIIKFIINKSLPLYFEEFYYIDILLNDNPYFITYYFEENFINRLDEIISKENDISKKVILSKIILTLINNFNELNEDKYNNYLNIENKYQNFINNNINIFNKEFNINYNLNIIQSKSIDEIYSDILSGLIQMNKFHYFEETMEIMTKLEFEKIKITKKMLRLFIRILNYDENCVKQYMISKLNDLLISMKINFYYIWLKYILKESFFIYQIPLFLNTRYYLKRIMGKTNFSKDYQKLEERAKYIIGFLKDSKPPININTKKDEGFNKTPKKEELIKSISNSIPSNISTINSESNYNLDINYFNSKIFGDIRIDSYPGKNIINLKDKNIVLSLDNRIIMLYEGKKQLGIYKDDNFKNIKEVNLNGKANICAICNNDIHLIEFDSNNKIKKIDFNEQISFFLEIKNNHYIILLEDKVVQYKNLFCEIGEKSPESFINEKYECGIFKNEKELILIKHGDNNNQRELIKIYDIYLNGPKRTIEYKEEYSFINNEHCLINNSLLCSSTKNQNNDYSLYFMDLDKDTYTIYKTNKFKVNCFGKVPSNNNNPTNIDYLFVGGEEDSKGKIKILKINSENNVIKINEMEEIQIQDSIKSVNQIKYSKDNNSLLIAYS